MPTFFVQTPFFMNPMTKTSKNIYSNKYHYKKMRPFGERTGDWICRNCRNLNFAFRTECNRCKLSKKEVMEIRKNNGFIDAKNNGLDNSNFSVNNNHYNNIDIYPYNNSNQNKNRNRYKIHFQCNENKSFIISSNNNKFIFYEDEDN
jgi:hypothetical protein